MAIGKLQLTSCIQLWAHWYIVTNLQRFLWLVQQTTQKRILCCSQIFYLHTVSKILIFHCLWLLILRFFADRAGSSSLVKCHFWSSEHIQESYVVASPQKDFGQELLHQQMVDYCGVWHAGPSRRFKRLCELFQSVLLSSSRGPPTARRISSDLASNSSSSSYNSIDRLSPTPSNDDVCLTPTAKMWLRFYNFIFFLYFMKVGQCAV